LRRSNPRTSRSAPLALLALGLAAAGAALSGCQGTTTSADAGNASRGKEIFTQKCGACHTLADAGTAGTTGPNLDDAFGYAREDEFDQSTFFEVTLQQMRIPGPPMPDYDDEDDPENYLTQEERVSVAAYVAEVAGKPCEGAGAGKQADDPKSIFSASCGSCHALEDAGTSGTLGPDLDDAKPSLEHAVEQITEGGSGMPAFKDRLTEEQIRALAEYVVEATKARRR
jgi:mono/diheme cytochrome c family protein